MRRLFRRLIDRVGLGADTPFDVGLWRRFLERVSATYVRSDEARLLSERSMDLSSREMHELHDRVRKANEQLEERVRERTADLARAELSARHSEARFRSLTELSSDWYWEQDEYFRFIELTGYSASAAGEGDPHRYLGRRRWETDLEILGSTWEEHRKVLSERRPFRDQQFRRRHPDGSVSYIAVSGEPVYDTAGAFKGYRGVGRDITERKRAEQLRDLEHAVARSMAEADSASAALKGAIRAICGSENWECGRCLQLDGKAGVMRFAEDWSVPSANAERYLAESRPVVYRPSDGLVGVVWQSGRPVWVPDTTKDPRVLRKRAARDSGLHGAIYFPVLSEGQIIGVLGFNSREVREPDEKLLQAVRAIGSQIGQYLRRKQAEQVLRESEERFRSLTELSSDVYWEQDRDYRFTSFSGVGTDRVSAAAARWVGRKRWDREYINMSPADWAAHIALLDARKPFRDLELCRLNEASERVWISVSGEPVFDASGEFTGYRGVGRDITESRREKELLTLEHAVTRCLAEAESVSGAMKGVLRAVCETERWECGRYFEPDGDANVLRFEQAWCVPDPAIERFVEETRALRFPPGVGLVGRAWQSTTPLWAADIATDPRTLKSGIGLRSGMRGIFAVPVVADGRALAVMCFSSSKPREPDERLMQAMRVIGSQVGQFLQRKQAEQVVRESEERFRTTINSAPVGVMHTSIEDDRILLANPKLSEMLGYSRDELLRMKTDDFIRREDVGEDRPKYREQMLRGEVSAFSSERRYVRKDGSTLWVNRTVSLARDSAGKPLYFIRIIEDVTERTIATRRRAMEHAVTQVLAEATAVQEAMPQILRIICQAQDWTCGARWEWTEAEELLRCAETWRIDAEGVPEFIAATIEKPNEAPAWRGAAPGTPTGGLVRRVWFSGASVWIPDVTQQADFRRGPVAARAGLRSAFGFPILAGTQPVGVMEFYSRHIERPDEALLQVVRAIGSQIGQFIQRKQAEDKVAHLAQFDTVTGLPNRYLFNDRLGLTIAQAQRNNWSVGVLFVDLDRFKAVNDTYGHAAGDMLLRRVAARLKECLRSSDIVGRLSGDEFALALPDLNKADDAGLVAQKIVDAMTAPFDLEGQQAYVSASIGIALFPSDGSEPDVLLRNADTAMYRAKEQGRSRYQFYLPQMNERLKQRLELEAKLRGALERGEYQLHYQPKVSLATGAISGFEALLRWQHEGRLVSPVEFISILEYTGLIVPVGEWVVRSACGQIKQWEAQGLAVPPIAVNLSTRQFQRKDLAEAIGAVLHETGVNPDLLELELTETLLMSDAEEAVEALRALKALGLRLAVDDFGTGYSSLAYLKRFPLDTLKIDRAFIRDCVSDPDDAAITVTITNLAHSLKLKVVAEGVETEGQLNFLKLHDCDEMQGYYFARPLPVEECTLMLIENRRLRLPQAAAAPGSPTALLVDDDEGYLVLLKRALATEGFRVLTANSARAGLELLAQHGADIVVSGHRMQEMSGIEFLVSVRKMYPNTVRVVASSGDDAPTLTRATNRAGIHRFLSKNWDPERLRAEVREAYEQRPRSRLRGA